MKTKKWLWITLASILTLVVLTGVAAAGYRLGLTQNPEFIKQMAELRAQRVSQFQKPAQNLAPQQNVPQGQNQQQGVPQGQMPAQGFSPRDDFGRGFDPHSNFERGSDRGFDGRDDFISPLFGLIRLAVLAALVWFGYKYVQNSGWKLVKVAPNTPVSQDTQNA
jgi:hypothetical protein